MEFEHCKPLFPAFQLEPMGEYVGWRPFTIVNSLSTNDDIMLCLFHFVVDNMLNTQNSTSMHYIRPHRNARRDAGVIEIDRLAHRVGDVARIGPAGKAAIVNVRCHDRFLRLGVSRGVGRHGNDPVIVGVEASLLQTPD